MTVTDIIIVVVAIGIVAFGIAYQIRRKKNNRGAGCCDGCSGCGVDGGETRSCPK